MNVKDLQDTMSLDMETIKAMAESVAKQRIEQLTANIGQKDFDMAGTSAAEGKKEYPQVNPNVANLDHNQWKDVVERAPTILCEKCDNHTFKVVYVVKRLSAYVSPTGEDMIAPIQTYQCTGCGHCNTVFLPQHAISDVINFSNPNIALTKEEEKRMKDAKKPAKRVHVKSPVIDPTTE